MPCDSGGVYDDLIPGTEAYKARKQRELDEQSHKDKMEQVALEERRHQEILTAIRESRAPRVELIGHVTEGGSLSATVALEMMELADEYAKGFCKLCHTLARTNPAELRRLIKTDESFAKIYYKHQDVDRKAGRPVILI